MVSKHRHKWFTTLREPSCVRETCLRCEARRRTSQTVYGSVVYLYRKNTALPWTHYVQKQVT
jgi:hypothetical protein